MSRLQLSIHGKFTTVLNKLHFLSCHYIFKFIKFAIGPYSKSGLNGDNSKRFSSRPLFSEKLYLKESLGDTGKLDNWF
jgi:hypothetical protein